MSPPQNPAKPGGNSLAEPTQQDSSCSAPKSELMLFWCLLGFSEQPFVVAPCWAVPSSLPASWVLDIISGMTRWTLGVSEAGVLVWIAVSGRCGALLCALCASV